MVNELLNILSKVWSHAVANRTLQLIIKKVTAINPSDILRAAVVHEVKVIGTAVTRISRLTDQTFTEHLG